MAKVQISLLLTLIAILHLACSQLTDVCKSESESSKKNVQVDQTEKARQRRYGWRNLSNYMRRHLFGRHPHPSLRFKVGKYFKLGPEPGYEGWENERHLNDCDEAFYNWYDKPYGVYENPYDRPYGVFEKPYGVYEKPYGVYEGPNPNGGDDYLRPYVVGGYDLPYKTGMNRKICKCKTMY